MIDHVAFSYRTYGSDVHQPVDCISYTYRYTESCISFMAFASKPFPAPIYEIRSALFIHFVPIPLWENH